MSKNEFEEGDRVLHRGEQVKGTVVDVNYPAPKFLVEWDEDTPDTLESLHSVEPIED